MPTTDEIKKEILKVVGEAFSEVFKETLAVVKTEIEQTKVSPAVGMMGVGHFNDLLHGGAYTQRVDQLPYYDPEIQKQLAFQSLRDTLGAGIVGLPSAVTVDLAKYGMGMIGIPAFAKPEQVEMILNSAAPRRFPKILSDQQAFLNKEWVSLFFSQNLTAGIVSNITTLVESGVSAAESLTGIIKAKGLGRGGRLDAEPERE